MHYIDTARYCSFLIFINSVLADNAGGVIACLQAKNVPFDVETAANWTSLVNPYHLRLQYIPIIITVPLTPEQAGGAVGCAAEHGLKVQAKSGEHSYASYSNGGVDGSLIVNLENLNTVILDKDTGIAKVDGGVRLGNQSDDFSAYLNYIDPNLSPAATIHFDKLTGVKKQLDPKHVFWNPKAVGMVEGKPVTAFMGTPAKLGLIGGWLLLYIIICGLGLGVFF